MAEEDGAKPQQALDDDQAAVYDRQLRVWGVEVQQKCVCAILFARVRERERGWCSSSSRARRSSSAATRPPPHLNHNTGSTPRAC
jgi:hypothetical protein